MTRNVVTTELVADQPVVVVLHHDQLFVPLFRDGFAQESIKTEYYSVTELLQSRAIQQRLEEAYKVAWLTGTEEWLQSQETVAQVDQLLSAYQHKVTLFFPIITAFTEQVSGELPYAHQFCQAQNEAILFHNSYLSSATFLFGQDIASQHLPTSFLFLLTQNLARGVVYSPTTAFHPQLFERYTQRSIRYFLQPQRASVLIRGNAVKGSVIAAEVKQLYQSYHFSLLDLQEVVGYSTQPLPFSVVENFVTDDVSSLVTHFVQSLPTPANLPKSSLWQQLFGEVTQNINYGTEVPPTVPQTHLIEPEYDSVEVQVVATVQTTGSAAPSSETQFVGTTKIAEVPQTTQVPSAQVAETTAADQTLATDTSSSPESYRGTVSAPETTSAASLSPKQAPQEFDLHQEIQSIFSSSRATTKQTQAKRIQAKTKTITKKTKKKTAFFYGGLAFTGMGLGIVCLAVVFVFSLNMFKKSLTTHLSNQVVAAEASTHEADLAAITRLRTVVELQTETYSLLLSLPALEDAQHMVELSKSMMTTVETTAQADELSKMLYLQVTGVDSGDVLNTAQNLGVKSVAAYESLSQFYEQLTTFASTADSAEIATLLKNYQQKIETEKNGIQSLQQLTPLLSDILGLNRKRTYAVVFQNNQELRPTGGFIEDVALLTFENGSLISSTVMSGYEVDAKMSGVVVPPDEVKQYLNEEGWHFVDANWNPHFPEAATQLAWFLEKSLGSTVDGVISIDLDGMATVLEVTGPLDLPQYNEVLTHKNIHDRFEFHSEISLVESKDDYRKQVFQAFVNRVTSLPEEKIVPFFGSLQTNLTNQHMLVSFTAADELNTVKNLGWSGSLLQPNCPSQLASANCVVDVVAQVEANVGVNKANYYLKRTIDHAVALEATQAAHSRTIVFENTAQSESWPKGPYKTFVRLYVPSSAVLNSIMIDGSVIAASAVSTTAEQNRAVLGFYVEVPIKQTRQVQVNYSVPYSASDTGFSYTFFEQQQPGSGETPFTLRVTSYSGLKPSVIAPQASFENGVITFSKNQVGHGFFGVKYN